MASAASDLRSLDLRRFWSCPNDNLARRNCSWNQVRSLYPNLNCQLAENKKPERFYFIALQHYRKYPQHYVQRSGVVLMCLNNVTYVFERHCFMQWMMATEKTV